MEHLKHLWDWYIGLFSDPDNKIKLAAWSATVATITFTITFLVKPLRNWFLGLFKKVKVKAGISHIFITSAFGASTGTPELTCTITNKGDKSIYINQPSIKTSKKISGYDTFSVASLKSQGTYPMKLEPGQQHTFNCNTADLYNQVLKRIEDRGKVKFIVSLTTGKKYSSNSITKSNIVAHLNAAQNNR